MKDKFFTTSATNMNYMFSYCGRSKLQSLDMGIAFTRIVKSDIHMEFTDYCGNSSTKIYVGEAIYYDAHNFRINADSNDSLWSGGWYNSWWSGWNHEDGEAVITPKYYIDWQKVSSTVDQENEKVTVVVKAVSVNTNYYSSDLKAENITTNMMELQLIYR